MKENLLIIGAGAYGLVAQEIAVDMNIFNKIDFIDDLRDSTPEGTKALGTTEMLDGLSNYYTCAAVAIGNANARLSIIEKLKNTSFKIVSLISPKAYISPAAKIMQGCIVEPMAVVHARAFLDEGCIVSAGAVINHESVCGRCSHIDCNATVASSAMVPEMTKVCYATVFENK